MTTKEMILNGVKRELANVAEGEYEAALREVEKNNGQKKTAVAIGKHGEAVQALLYIDDIVGPVERGEASLEDEVAKLVRAFLDHSPDFDAQGVFEKNFILENIFAQVVNRKKNEERASKSPHFDILDLTVFYRFWVNDSSSAVITNDLMRTAGISIDELESARKRNVEKEGFKYTTITNMMNTLCGDFAESEEATPGLYVLTNKDGNMGATVLLEKEIFSKLAEKFGDLYVLPSSIHEVLALPASIGGEPDDLRAMVASINTSVVSPEEVLSNECYFFDSKTGELRIA